LEGGVYLEEVIFVIVGRGLTDSDRLPTIFITKISHYETIIFNTVFNAYLFDCGEFGG